MTYNDGLIPLKQAAEILGIDTNQLMCYIMRNSLSDPIGGSTPDGVMVYEWSLSQLKKKLAEGTSHDFRTADRETGVTP